MTTLPYPPVTNAEALAYCEAEAQRHPGKPVRLFRYRDNYYLTLFNVEWPGGELLGERTHKPA